MKLPSLLFLFCLASLWPSFTPTATAAEASPSFKYEEVDVKPTPKKPIKVRFPSSVRKKGETPQIVLRFEVSKEGDVKKLVVVKFSDPDMIEPAMAAYETTKYTPGMKGGQPVATLMEVTESYPSK